MKERNAYDELLAKYGEPIYTWRPAGGEDEVNSFSLPTKYAVFALPPKHLGDSIVVYALDEFGWFASPDIRPLLLKVVTERNESCKSNKLLFDANIFAANQIKEHDKKYCSYIHEWNAAHKLYRRNLYSLGIFGCVLTFALSGLGLGGLIAALVVLGCAYLVEYLLP